MIVEFDKAIYDKDSIYSSVDIWKDYFQSASIKETKEYIIVSMSNTDNILDVCTEFCNFVLDTASSKELGK